MSWKTIFQTYQNQEVGKKGKEVNVSLEQVSQFSLFPAFGETKKSNNQCAQTLGGVDLKKLKTFLGEDWDDYKNNPESLALWADLLLKNQLIEQGQVPDNFTAITCCDLCGYVYVPPALANGGKVLGCPWCWNRVKGLPIPKILLT